MAEILDGKEASAQWLVQMASELKGYTSRPTLALIRVGEDEASGIYVSKKEQACKKLGIESKVLHYESDISQLELISKIRELNSDSSISAMIVQLPLPSHIDSFVIQETIDPKKDADGFTTKNQGLLAVAKPRIVAATPAGVMKLLEHYKLDVSKKHCVVVGRSNIVGKPLAQLLLNANATVSITHSQTPDISFYTKKADFLFVAVGREKLITSDMVKEGAVVIDVGICRTKEGTVCGDCDFESIKNKASYITPVPGGVGPMTVASLLNNTLICYKLQNKGE
jgi:methylenetetrahydrofolate dehydrogenase (NADP+) / methenyltetrahydrofolate cyclohydrolase